MVHGNSFLFLEVISGIASSMCLHSLKLASTHSFKSSAWLPLNCKLCLHCCAYGLLPQHLENHSDAKNAVELTSSDQQLGVDKHLDSLTAKAGQSGAICGALSQSFHPGVSLGPLLVRWLTESIWLGRLPYFTSTLPYSHSFNFPNSLLHSNPCVWTEPKLRSPTNSVFLESFLGQSVKSPFLPAAELKSKVSFLLFFFFPHLTLALSENLVESISDIPRVWPIISILSDFVHLLREP